MIFFCSQFSFCLICEPSVEPQADPLLPYVVHCCLCKCCRLILYLVGGAGIAASLGRRGTEPAAKGNRRPAPVQWSRRRQKNRLDPLSDSAARCDAALFGRDAAAASTAAAGRPAASAAAAAEDGAGARASERAASDAARRILRANERPAADAAGGAAAAGTATAAAPQIPLDGSGPWPPPLPAGAPSFLLPGVFMLFLFFPHLRNPAADSWQARMLPDSSIGVAQQHVKLRA